MKSVESVFKDLLIVRARRIEVKRLEIVRRPAGSCDAFVRRPAGSCDAFARGAGEVRPVAVPFVQQD